MGGRPAPGRPDAQSVLWFYGADAVGKSTVGWEAYRLLVGRGLPSAFVDTDHLGWCSPRPEDPSELVAGNLAAVWRRYREEGIRHLVVAGILVTEEHRARFTEALGAPFVAVLLQARPATIRSRITGRRQAEATAQGTTLSTEVLAELAAYAERSTAFAELLDRGTLADLRLPTDDDPPDRIAAAAIARALSLDP